MMERGSACLGAPYLYVTFHGGQDRQDINTVYIYSRDGCHLGEALTEDTELLELRGMVVYGSSLLIANAYRESSFVVQYGGACSQDSLEPLRILVPEGTPGLDHPYGVAVDHRYIYVSTQGTNSVFRYELTTGNPANLAPAVADDKHADDYYPGLFTRFDPDDDSTRAIAIDSGRGHVYVANKDEGVYVYDTDGYKKHKLKVKKPIGVTYCESRDSVFVGSKKDSNIVEFDAHTWKKIGTYKDDSLSHPAGLVCYGKSSLFVVSQDEGAILEFDLTNGKAWIVVDDLPDVGEQLILSREC